MTSRWQTVAAFPSAIEAHAARTKLESEGIDCFVADEHTVGVNPLYANAIGGIRVQVGPEDLERARAALGEVAKVDMEQFKDAEVIKCPKCSSEKLERRVFAGPFSAAAWFIGSMLFFVLPWARPKWKCLKCGATFRSSSPRRKSK